MTHLPFIAAAYALTLGVIAWLWGDIALRSRRARQRLAALDPRARAGRKGRA